MANRSDTEVLMNSVIERLKEGSSLMTHAASQEAERIAKAGEQIAEALSRGGKVMLFGNGGSAADAQHIATELVGRFQKERSPLPAIALTTDTSALTAIANDYGFDHVFARQVQALGSLDDVVIAISTSGGSANVVRGVEYARERGLFTIGIAGGDGGPLGDLADISIVVPSTNTARIQECHIAVGHLLCEIIEDSLFEDHQQSDTSGRHVESSEQKVVNWDSLLSLRAKWQAEEKTVVWTNGCFDLLHVGHVHSLSGASRLGDVLVVGLNSDASVRALKGKERPLVPVRERAQILAALECVDYVIVFDEPTPEAALSKLQPDIHCKGREYARPHGNLIPEAELVESFGGRIEFLPTVPSISTSHLIERIQAMGEADDHGAD